MCPTGGAESTVIFWGLFIFIPGHAHDFFAALHLAAAQTIPRPGIGEQIIKAQCSHAAVMKPVKERLTALFGAKGLQLVKSGFHGFTDQFALYGSQCAAFFQLCKGLRECVENSQGAF